MCSEDIPLNVVSMQKMLLTDLDQGQVFWCSSDVFLQIYVESIQKYSLILT